MDSSRRAFLTIGGGALAGAALGGGYRLACAAPDARVALRPPGAGTEAEFLAACIRCAQCAEACPADALRPAPLSALLAAATPRLDDAASRPCTLCPGRDELACIAACPTTALQLVQDLRDICIGVAVLDEEICLAFDGVICRSCWHACPYPGDALAYDERLRPHVVRDACIGCGLCVRACPTEPKSLALIPLDARP